MVLAARGARLLFSWPFTLRVSSRSQNAIGTSQDHRHISAAEAFVVPLRNPALPLGTAAWI